MVGEAARRPALLNTGVLNVQLLDLGGELRVPSEVGVGAPTESVAVGGSLGAEQHQGHNRVGESHRSGRALMGLIGVSSGHAETRPLLQVRVGSRIDSLGADSNTVPELCYGTSVNCAYKASINDRTSVVAAGNDCRID